MSSKKSQAIEQTCPLAYYTPSLRDFFVAVRVDDLIGCPAARAVFNDAHGEECVSNKLLDVLGAVRFCRVKAAREA
jgi:hypothetical protein